MSALTYPARFVRDSGSYDIRFPDFPEAHTFGATKEEAFAMAIDCLHSVIDWRLSHKEEIPAPSPAKRGQIAIPVPLEIAPKLALYQAMKEQRISNVKLAKHLNVRETVVRRMLNPKHKSKPEQYTRALRTLGRAVEVSVIHTPGESGGLNLAKAEKTAK